MSSPFVDTQFTRTLSSPESQILLIIKRSDLDVIPDQIRNNRAERDIYTTIKASYRETITATGSDAERVALHI